MTGTVCYARGGHGPTEEEVRAVSSRYPRIAHTRMPTILLIKTSSLGDVVHNLPVVTDIRARLPDAAIDWVVEKSFAAIPAMHPGVRRVVACELRAWRRAWARRDTRSAWRAFVGELRSARYDCVIDTQGLLKSALVARAADGFRVGLDWKSSREPLRPFYDKVYRVPWTLHAVERNRRLAGLALAYEVSGVADYGIAAARSDAAWLPRAPYVVLQHGTSHPRKLWQEEAWVELGERLAQEGIAAILPWGSTEEGERATRLAARIPNARVAPPVSVGEIAQVMAGARAVIGVDTGLTHLAAALGVPVIGVYGATDPRATGIHATGPVVNLGTVGRFPTSAEVLGALARFGVAA